MEYLHHYTSPLGIITMAADDSGLTGYAGGIERKLALLKQEGIQTENLTIPQKGTVH